MYTTKHNSKEYLHCRKPQYKISDTVSIQIINVETGDVLLETTCDTKDIDINPKSCSVKLNRECNLVINNN